MRTSHRSRLVLLLTGLCVLGLGEVARADRIRFASPTGAGTHSGLNPSNAMTLVQAIVDVRSVPRPLTENVVVHMLEGEYYVTSPVVLNQPVQDSGNGSFYVIYRAWKPEPAPFHNVIIHGGRKVTGTWMNTGSVPGGVLWAIDVRYPDPLSPSDPPPLITPSFRDLYFNNQRLTRCRYPNKDCNGRDALLYISYAGYGPDPGSSTWNVSRRHYGFYDTSFPTLGASQAGVEIAARLHFSMPRQTVNAYQQNTQGYQTFYMTADRPLGWVPPCRDQLPPNSVITAYNLTPGSCGAYSNCPQRSYCYMHWVEVHAKGGADPFTPTHPNMSPPHNVCNVGAWPGTSSPLPPEYPGHRAFIENHSALLDGPYEWYLNPSTGYLWVVFPQGVDPSASTNTTVYPVADALWHMSNVTNVQLYHLNFAFTNNDLPACGYNSGQSGHVFPLNTFEAPGAVKLVNTPGAKVTGCRIAHTGASGLQVLATPCNPAQPGGDEGDPSGSESSGGDDGDGTEGGCPAGIQIVGNKVFDIGGTGIYLAASTGEGNITDGHLIQGNLVFDVGQTFYDNVGIFVGNVTNMFLQQNEIARTPWSAVSFGRHPFVNQPSGNQIMQNRIHDAMRILEDGAAIYMENGLPGAVHSNYIYNVTRYEAALEPSNTPAGVSDFWRNYGGGAALYWDHAAAGWVVHSNVIQNIPLLMESRTDLSPPCEYQTVNNGMYYGSSPSFTWGTNYSTTNPIPSGTWAYDPATGTCHQSSQIPNVVDLYVPNTACTPVAAAATVMANAGIHVGYNYAYDTLNPQIDPPGAAVGLPVPSSSLPAVVFSGAPCP
jgi:hypothetical protein